MTESKYVSYRIHKDLDAMIKELVDPGSMDKNSKVAVIRQAIINMRDEAK